MRATVSAIIAGGGVLLFSMLPASAANRVVVNYEAGVPCGPVQISIAVENDVDLSTLNIPLVVRTTSGGFWVAPIDTLPATGRLANALTGTRYFETGRVDYVSPDQVNLFFSASSPADCLPAGPLENLTGLSFKVYYAGGFEIDTMAYAPCYELSMLACPDDAPVPIDGFTKGVVEILPGGCPYGQEWETGALSAWAGATLTNILWANDPEADPAKFWLVSGPGEIDSMSGVWNWASSPSDSGVHVVTGQAYDIFCGPNTCVTRDFTIDLRPLLPGDLNCDGVINVLDVVIEVNSAFRNDPPPVPCWDREE